MGGRRMGKDKRSDVDVRFPPASPWMPKGRSMDKSRGERKGKQGRREAGGGREGGRWGRNERLWVTEFLFPLSHRMEAGMCM